MGLDYDYCFGDMGFEMNLFWAVLFVAAGVVLLWKSAELLVSGAVGLASRFGISRLVIGLTVVAMGTSAPEVAASIAAALKGMGDIAIGNVYGSNIANLALVGGVIAIIGAVGDNKRTVRREMLVMGGVGLLLWPVIQNFYLSRMEGILLLVVFVGLLFVTVYAARKKGAAADSGERESAESAGSVKRNVFFVLAGLAGLAFGAEITLDGATFIGERVGLSEAVIGLSIVAIVTSLPELVTCVVASLKGHNDISIGNLIGSNIFNSLLVTGMAGVIRPFELAGRLAGFDYWVMMIVTAGFICMAAKRGRVGRVGGVVLLCGYAGYMVYVLT